MNEIIVIEPADTLPVIPENWDYGTSIEKTKTFFYKWKNLTNEILEELWISRKILKKNFDEWQMRGGTNIPPPTWDDYCKEIGTERRTVNRWLEKTYISKKITEPHQPDFDENIKTDHQCPSCGYEW